MASLADISRHAGVSIATASRVLNGSTHPVSDGTRGRVLAAADELGYRPSELARALVKRTSRIIGVIVGDIVDPYFAEIARGVEDVAARGRPPHDGLQRRPASGGRARRISACCATTTRPASCSRAAATSTRPRRPCCASWSTSCGRPERSSSRSRRATSTARACSSTTAPPRYDATEHLLSLGHRRIAFVAGPAGPAHQRAPPRGLPGGDRRGRRRARRACRAASSSRRAPRRPRPCSPTCPTPSSASTTRWPSAC